MKKLIITVSVIVVMVFSVFVYPTAYSYHNTNDGFLVKINRFTGTTWGLSNDGDGWVRMNKEN